MSDRFDLLEPSGVQAAMRTTSNYCRLVDPSRLRALDIDCLDQGRVWLLALEAEIMKFDTALVFDSHVMEIAPQCSVPSTSPESALAAFSQSNTRAQTAVAMLLRSPASTIVVPTGTVSYLDVARHLARISNSCSVDRRWP